MAYFPEITAHFCKIIARAIGRAIGDYSLKRKQGGWQLSEAQPKPLGVQPLTWPSLYRQLLIQLCPSFSWYIALASSRLTPQGSFSLVLWAYRQLALYDSRFLQVLALLGSLPRPLQLQLVSQPLGSLGQLHYPKGYLQQLPQLRSQLVRCLVYLYAQVPNGRINLTLYPQLSYRPYLL